MIIYKTTNTINGKFYVGKDSKNNPAYFGSGMILQKAIAKYGKENFKKEILEYCSVESINDQEIFWIDKLNAIGDGYNITSGGEGGDTTSNHPNKLEIIKLRSKNNIGKHNISPSIETRKKISIGTKRAMNRPEVKEKLNKDKLGVPLSDDHKFKIGTGVKSSQKYQLAILNSSRSKKMVNTKKINGTLNHSIETKHKISKNNKSGTMLVKKKISDWNLKNSPKATRFVVKNLESNEIFNLDRYTELKAFIKNYNKTKQNKDKVPFTNLVCNLKCKALEIIRKEAIYG